MLQTRAKVPVVLHEHRLEAAACGVLLGETRLLVFLQAELIVGDQSGAIHIWDLKTDHNEQLIPEPEVSVNSVHIDPDASYMAAVNSSVSSDGLARGVGFTVLRSSASPGQGLCTYQLHLQLFAVAGCGNSGLLLGE